MHQAINSHRVDWTVRCAMGQFTPHTYRVTAIQQTILHRSCKSGTRWFLCYWRVHLFIAIPLDATEANNSNALATSQVTRLVPPHLSARGNRHTCLVLYIAVRIWRYWFCHRIAGFVAWRTLRVHKNNSSLSDIYNNTLRWRQSINS